MRLTTAQCALLVALQQGDRLKVHRTLDGAKSYRLHRLDASGAEEVDGDAVDALVRAGLIESNLKFPAAAFLLTDKGVAVVAPLTGKTQTPAGSRNFA